MQDAILLGIGKIGIEAIPFLEREYRILFLADNDKMRWGTVFQNYTIECPDKIKDCTCKVIITSTRYGAEMAEQLENMGIARDRIYFCHKCITGNVLNFEVCPSEEPLIQYDLFHAEECTTDRRKVLIFCNGYSVYTKQLIENISKRYDDIEFSLITRAKENKEKIASKYLKHIYCFKTTVDLRSILEQLPVYDAMQLLWIERNWASVYKLIRNRTKKLNLNVGGSDFYRADKKERDFKRKLIACADKIAAEIRGTVQEFKEYYKEETEGKMELLPFGVEVLDYIESCKERDKNELKRKYNIPLGKIVITCAHNAFRENRHLELIDTLSELSDKVKQEIVCVFPMTYPDNMTDYIREVEGRLEESGLDYVIMTEFMDFQAMAEYALISDIMIRVQTTDQLSSMMLEAMYAGSLVIAGSWLPYLPLHEIGMYFLDVNTILEVTAVLKDVVANIEDYKGKCKKNSEIVWNHSSWDVLASRWHALWE